MFINDAILAALQANYEIHVYDDGLIVTNKKSGTSRVIPSNQIIYVN